MVRHRLLRKSQQEMMQLVAKRKRVLIIGIASVTAILLLYSFFTSNPSVTAQTADNILRPIFGEKKTLALESVYFSISEAMKRVKYTFIKPDSSMLFSNNTTTLSISGRYQGSSALNLSPIPLITSFTSLPGEGIWQAVPSTLFPNEVVVARTLVRPDPTRSYAAVAIVQFDAKKVGLNIEAGTRFPGGSLGVPGPGFIPQQIQQSNSLLAGFNGGFQERDGHYGMTVGTTVYVPLRTGLASLLMFTDGSVKLVNYDGSPLPKNVASVRQNGPLLLENGQITPFVEAGRDTWGRTITNSLYTWRSGLGITKEGNIMYAVGQSLLPSTLARALQMAGAVNAMQLDINPFWVRFFFYTPLGNGSYTSTPLLKQITKNGGNEYLHGYEKDFFYVYKR